MIRSGYLRDHYFFQEPNTGLYPYEKVAIELIEQSNEGSQISSRLFVLRLKIVGLFRKIFGFLGHQPNHIPGGAKVLLQQSPLLSDPIHTEVISVNFDSEFYIEKTKNDGRSWHERWAKLPRHMLANTNHLDQKEIHREDQNATDIEPFYIPNFNEQSSLIELSNERLCRAVQPEVANRP